LLAKVCADDVSDARFPFLAAGEITVGLASVMAVRVSFTGELGYELYMAPEYQRHVYDALIEAGRAVGLRHFGVRALNSLRLEKGYGAWGREYTQDYMPAEAGMQRFIDTTKPDFIGRNAVLENAAGPTARQLRLLAIRSDDLDPVGGETVLHDGRPIARLTSGAFGHTVGYSLGFAYLPPEIALLTEGLEVDLLGSRHSARVLEEAPYDPAGKRLRG